MSKGDALARIAVLTYRLDRMPGDDVTERRPLMAERNQLEQQIGGYQDRDAARIDRVLDGLREAGRVTA